MARTAGIGHQDFEKIRTKNNFYVDKTHFKSSFEILLSGGHLKTPVDEQIVYNMLDTDESAIWSLLLASGYLKVIKAEEPYETQSGTCALICELAITNYEVKLMFCGIIHGWFSGNLSDYNDFIKAFLSDDIKAMNLYMNRVSSQMFSCFDTGKQPSKKEPERFYHGFVLGLIVELADRYVITSNRESGFGRYDVMLEPRNHTDDAVILEFKVHDCEDEKELSDTVKAALHQINKKNYASSLIAKGFSKDRIRRYGFAFRGNEVLIGKQNEKQTKETPPCI